MLFISAISLATFGADFCIGDNLVRTVNGHHYNVRVLEIYQDGTVEVEYTNSQFSNDNINIRELSRALNELDGVQVGDNLVRTVNGHHYNVRVLEIYQDETVEVAYISGQYSNDNINIRELSRARHCTELESCSK
jgi:hypothetical protein